MITSSPPALLMSQRLPAATSSPANGSRPIRADQLARYAAHLPRPQRARRRSQLIDLLRLARAAGALTGETDYFALRQRAGRHGQSGRSQGGAGRSEGRAKMIDAHQARCSRDLNAPAGQAAADPGGDRRPAKAALAGGTAQGADRCRRCACTASAPIAEAVPLYRAALAKGGVDASLANLHLGMALARRATRPARPRRSMRSPAPMPTSRKYWLLWLATKA